MILSTANSQSGGGGAVTIKGPARVTAPGQRAIYAHYDGQWLDHTDIRVRATRPLNGALGTATLTTTPAAVEINTSTGCGGQFDATVGPDGNPWFVCGGDGVLKVVPPASATYFSCCSGYPTALSAGADGNVWVSQDGGGKLNVLSPAGAQLAHFSVICCGRDVALGPDAKLWYGATSGYISKFTTAGVSTDYNLGHSIGALAVGRDKNIWYGTMNDNVVGAITVNGASVCSATVPYTFNGYASKLVAAPDGNMWIYSAGNGKISRITPTCGVTTYTATSAGGQYDGSMTLGADGNLWYSATNGIGRMTLAGVATVFTTGFSGNVNAVIGGTDGNIWFVGDSRVGKFVL